MSLFALSYFLFEIYELYNTVLNVLLSYSLDHFLNASLGLIGAIIGGFLSLLGAYLVFKGQIRNEQKNVSKAIDLDLQNIYNSQPFFTYYIFYKTDPETIMNGVHAGFRPRIPPATLYDKENGNYLLYKRDIAKLNYNLAKDIYEFYNNLLTAENYRLLLIQNPNFISSILQTQPNPISSIDYECLFKYPKMTELVLKCGDDIKKIRNELKDVIME